ncbi:MAG: hypothetical protein FJ242_07060 [Nitrospira sp.]|nr:hypothetical protein [Nitrospira sp.]
MEKVTIILQKPPYGKTNAAEAIRHALGGVSDGLDVQLILVNGGVLLAKKGQNDTGRGLTNLEEALKEDCLEMAVGVYADKLSLREQRLELTDLVEGIKVANGIEIAELIKESKATIIF